MATEVEWRSLVEKLWNLLDDIDTLDDAARDNDVWYRKQAYIIQKKRWETGITTNGYVITMPWEPPPEEYKHPVQYTAYPSDDNGQGLS